MLGAALKAARAAAARVFVAVKNDATFYVAQKLDMVEPGELWRYRRFFESEEPAVRVAEHGLCTAAAQACSTASYHAAGVESLLLAVAEDESRPHRLAAAAGYVAGLVAVGFSAAQQAFAERAEETREREPFEALHEEFGGTKARDASAHGIFGLPCDDVGRSRGGIFG